jgi:predicted RNA binding protein YcfA (HicA-like mRNA interferase family)
MVGIVSDARGVWTALGPLGYNAVVGSIEKILEQVLRGTSDANVAFRDLRQLLLRLGFEERTKGSHHIFRRPGIPDLLTLQRDGSKAKPYQVRQVRRVIVDHRLADDVNG